MTLSTAMARVHELLKDAKPGVPVPIPPDLAAEINAEIRERSLPALEAIRRRERNVPRWVLDMVVD